MTGGKIKKPILLIVSIVNVLFLSLGHAYNNQALLWFALAIFSASVIFSQKSNFLPLMLFYLPWASLLKTRPNTHTFASLVIPIILFIVLVEIKQRNKIVLLIGISFFFTAYTLFVKSLNALPLQTPYLLFIIKLFFISFYVSEYKEEIRFERCVLFLTAGVLSASFGAQNLLNYPHMFQYITIDYFLGVPRLSGLTGDPNYYAAQILVTIAALLVVLSKSTRKSLIALQIVSIMALLYFGLQSVSKMFMICVVVLVFLWMFNVLIQKRNISYKFGILMSVLILLGIVVGNYLFLEQINYYLMRVRHITDLNTLTTGRSDLWRVYLNYLSSHIDKLFFGIGLSQDQVRILLKTNNAHFTPIEMTYQLGITGVLILFSWWNVIYHQFVDKTKMAFSEYIYFIIMVSSVFLPWFALDMIYNEEFFYFILLLLLSKSYLSKKGKFKYVSDI